MIEFKLNIASAQCSAADVSTALLQLQKSTWKKSLKSILKKIKYLLCLKISEDCQLTRESTDHHNSDVETGRVKGTLCWQGGRAGQHRVLVLELLTHRVSHAWQGWVW